MARRKTAPRPPPFHPGGDQGKLHRELSIDESRTIPAKKLAAATHSRNPEIRRDAIRAETMKRWAHRRWKRGGRADGTRPIARADKPRRH
jgi:hypothetical protein